MTLRYRSDWVWAKVYMVLAAAGGGRLAVRTSDRVAHVEVDVVSVAEFREFVQSTGWETEAEGYGWSLVALPPSDDAEPLAENAIPPPLLAREIDWWQLAGVSWAGGLAEDGDAVGHVSFHDAEGYCSWRDPSYGRVASVEEWEALPELYRTLSAPAAYEWLGPDVDDSSGAPQATIAPFVGGGEGIDLDLDRLDIDVSADRLSFRCAYDIPYDIMTELMDEDLDDLLDLY
ncbi:uncharacterized protein AMSG_08184 [Thecamonas trahens ATCC 50062]|uniref:Uncharacterized protein n=1 Tax=Thecamonas trahens ATCC 50062 TaxID=461836 RepID=A0A0L0DIL3_THETB|nr:hypothetical protein AMSG_08184 [Thecamonas trahens ATCC 50062]KNC51941.1 hypothetical protein AMSG_08184 [Thecamonas trahens ATCC 50062]|eukprot:XP_013755534.1 hypothetical protein AMSG_08184 [Thecamonas trahens ATCC 50062]